VLRIPDVNREDLPKVDARRDADGVTTFTVARGVRPEDLIRALSAFMGEAPTRLVLWDLRQASFSTFTNDDMRWMVSQLSKFSGAERLGGRSAFVVAHDEDYGVMRMLTTYAELGGYLVSLRVFRDVDVARAWLLGRGPVA
jgi:hypothetical protein